MDIYRTPAGFGHHTNAATISRNALFEKAESDAATFGKSSSLLMSATGVNNEWCQVARKKKCQRARKVTAPVASNQDDKLPDSYLVAIRNRKASWYQAHHRAWH
jgi:hypothetical protein